MATTSNSYTGNNSTVDFAFTFPYLNTTDIKVSLDGVVKTLTTDYTLHNATTIRFGSAPGTDVAVKIYRDTSSDNLAATFYPGSAIRSSDINDNYTQNLYVTQEADNNADEALSNSRVLESGAYVSAITKASTASTASTVAQRATDRLVATTANDGATWTLKGNNTNASTDPKGVGYAVTQAENAVSVANAASTSVSSVLPYSIVANATTLQAYFDDSDVSTPTIDADDIFELTSTADLPDFIKGATWAQSTAYKVNDQVFVNSKLYRCTVAGTSAGAGSGPSHSSSTATDGTVTWIHEANSDGKWTINSKPDPMPTFSAGITVKLKFASGNSSASVWTWQSYHANNPETRYAATGSDLNFTGALDIDGTVQLDNTVTVGVNDTGKDVKLFGATAGAYLLWDESEDDLVLAGVAGFDVNGDIDIDGTANLDNTDIDGTLVVDGSNISLDSTSTLNIDNSNTSNGVTIATATSGVPISIGHATSETTVNDNLTVTGDLTVSGTTTTVNTTNLNVEDPLIKLAKNNDGGDTLDIGFYGLYDATGSQDVYTGLFRDQSDSGKWKLFELNQAEPSTTVNTSGTGYAAATLVVGGLEVLGQLNTSSNLLEAAKITAGKLSDNANLNLEDGNVFLFTTQESTTATPNLRWNGSTTLTSKMSVGDCISVTIITTAHASGFSAQLTIDGGAVTENWIGGSAPDAGGDSGLDIHSYTIIKTGTSGTANNDFKIIANHTKTS